MKIAGQKDSEMFSADYREITSEYFRTLGTPARQGRAFTAADSRDTHKVAIINAAFARKYFAGRSSVGEHLDLTMLGDAQREIVGVAGDAKYDEVSKEVMPTVYTPSRTRGDCFALRTAIDPKTLVPTVRRAVREIDPRLPILSIQTQSELIDKTLFEQRLIADLPVSSASSRWCWPAWASTALSSMAWRNERMKLGFAWHWERSAVTS